MADVSQMFNDADRQRVNQAVQDAEAVTSAEIVPVITRTSGRYDRAEDIVGLWFAVLAMTFVWFVYPLPRSGVATWDALAPIWQLVALIAGALLGFVVGAIVGSRIDWLRRLFTPRTQMKAEVGRRAREVFFDKRMHHTGSGSGVLLYISLYEHRAAVIADQSVLDKLGQQGVDEICREFTQRLHESTPIDAFCETASSLGQQLAGVLPRTADRQNELPNALVVIN